MVSGSPVVVKTNLDSTVVQMYSSDWWTAPSGRVFNGWYVVINESAEGNSKYLLDKLNEPHRIMPGDGIVFGGDNASSYDPTYGVLTVPEDVKLEAQWESVHYSTYAYSANTLRADLGTFHIDSTIFTNEIKLSTDIDWTSLDNSSIFTACEDLGSLWRPNLQILPGSAVTIDGDGYTLIIPANIQMYQDIYFKNINLVVTGSMGLESGGLYAQGHRLIIGEGVTTSYSGGISGSDWYKRINDDPTSTHAGFILHGGSNSKDVIVAHMVIQSGQFSSVIGGGITGGISSKTYLSVGNSKSSNGPNIFAVYGGSFKSETPQTNVQVNSGNIMELLGGGRTGTISDSTNVEINGGYVSYLNGGPRGGNASVGNNTALNTAVRVSVTGGSIDYLFGGVKDGNEDSDVPVKGNIEIKVTGGNIYSLCGGGYDFWAAPVFPGVSGDIFITITGGKFGLKNNISLNLNNSETVTHTSYYYDKEAGIYGGGYRGSVVGSVTIKIGSSDAKYPVIIGDASGDADYNGVNIYGGGSGGKDDSSNNGGKGWYDSTGISKIKGSTKVVIGNAIVHGSVYGGGKGVSKSSDRYYDTTNGKDGGIIIEESSGTTSNPAQGSSDVAAVTGNTTVQIQDSAVINGNVFGGGKGVSKSVYIDWDSDSSTLKSSLYNILDSKYTLPAVRIDHASYLWQSVEQDSQAFSDIPGATNSTLNPSSVIDKYVRLKISVTDAEGNHLDTIYSNSVLVTKKNNGFSVSNPLSREVWESWNRNLIQSAIVIGNSAVNIENGTITGSVYGGGSYGAVGSLDIHSDISLGYTQYDLSGKEGNYGQTDLQIQSGTIKGSVYGGGMGEPNGVTAGSVGLSSSIIMGNDSNTPNIGGNIYGGGKNGFVGGTVSNVYITGMVPLRISGSDTNTYCFNLKLSYIRPSGSEELPGVSAVDIYNVNFNNLNESTDKKLIGNVFGGGYGVNATVTGSTDVNISGGTFNNIYGGGELGMVGKLTGQGTGSTLNLDGGETSVNITAGSNNVIINGSIYGGGMGFFTTEADYILLGSVGGSSEVSLYSADLDKLTVKGSVYGGGELGLIGNYTVTKTDTETLLNFSGGETTVKIGGGKIYDNVYGGGKGDPYNTLSGAVGKTNVIISGTAGATNGLITNPTTQIGYVEPSVSSPKSPSENSGQNQTPADENSPVSEDVILSAEGTAVPSAFNFTDHEDLTEKAGRSYIAVAKPVYGSIKVAVLDSSSKETTVTSINTLLQDNRKYDIYDVSEDSNLKLTYSDSKTRYLPDWYKYDNAGTLSSLESLGDDQKVISYVVPIDNSTIYAAENDTYNTNITVIKPDNGQITVTLGDEVLALAPESASGENYIYAAPVGETLTFTYSSPADLGYYVSKWTGASQSKSDKNTATLTVPSVGNNVSISVSTQNDYTITVEKPDCGKILVYSLPESSGENADHTNTLIDNLIPIYELPSNSQTYPVKYGTKLMFHYVPEDSTVNFVKRWMSSPIVNMAQAQDDSDIMVMKVTADTTISVLEGPAVGNVYGGGAYGIVGNITLDITSPDEYGYHKIVNADNNANVNVAILGGKIGADNAARFRQETSSAEDTVPMQW